MKLTAFEYGKTEINEKMAFPDGNEQVKIPIALLFFLIETENRKILVDVGCDTMPGFELFEFKKPADLLSESGISPEDITDILLSHTHHDHVDALRHYNDTNIYIHEKEKNAINKYLNGSGIIHTFKDEIKITNRITMKHIGGHSPGSCVILIDNKYVLCGDECYVKENLILKIPTGSSVCPQKSFRFVNDYSNAKYIPILFHDPDIVGMLGKKIIFDN